MGRAVFHFFCVCTGSCLFLLLNLGVIGYVASGPGVNDPLHSDAAVGLPLVKMLIIMIHLKHPKAV